MALTQKDLKCNIAWEKLIVNLKLVYSKQLLSIQIIHKLCVFMFLK